MNQKITKICKKILILSLTVLLTVGQIPAVFANETEDDGMYETLNSYEITEAAEPEEVQEIGAAFVEIMPFSASVSTQAELQAAINASTIANGWTRANPRVITITHNILMTSNQAITVPAGVNFQLITNNPNGVTITRSLVGTAHQPRHFNIQATGQTDATERTFILGQPGNRVASNITLNVLENATMNATGEITGTLLSPLRTRNQSGGGIVVFNGSAADVGNSQPAVATANTHLIMHDGVTITGGRHHDNGGALRFGTGVTFFMEGGRLVDNAANVDAGAQGDGGAVFISGTGQMIMNGGEIAGNWRQGGATNTTLTTGGGGVFLNVDHHSVNVNAAAGTGPTFTMNGGVIRDNWVLEGVGGGGGVHVGAGATFTMNGGTISDHFATDRNQGGGVLVRGSGIFNMNGGTITNNTSAQNGGGVWVATTSTFNMTGGTISYNEVGRTITVHNPGANPTAYITFTNGFNPDGSPVTHYITNRNLANGGGVFTQCPNFLNINLGNVGGQDTSNQIVFYGNVSAAHDGSPLFLIMGVAEGRTTFPNVRWNNWMSAHNTATTSLPDLPAHILNNWDVNLSTGTDPGGTGGPTPFDRLQILEMVNGGQNASMSGTNPVVNTSTSTLLTLAGSTATVRVGVRSGFDFSHWTTSTMINGIHNSSDVETSGIMPAQNVTVTAHWTRRVTFNLLGGNIGGDISNPIVNVPEFVSDGNVQLPADPVRENHDFGGWRLPDGTIIPPGGSFPNVLPEGPFVVEAVWAPTIRVVTLEPNGTDVSTLPGSIEVLHGSSLGSDLPTPNRLGFNFIGWNTESDGSGDRIFANTAITRDKTIYAQWEAIVRTVTFHAAGGTGAPAPVNVQMGHQIGAQFPTSADNPVRPGFRFTGWGTAVNGTGDLVTADFIVNNNITVFAQWEEVVIHRVTFVMNGGTIAGSPANTTASVADGDAIGSNNMPVLDIRQGFDPPRWNTAPDGSGVWIDENTVITGDITVYAIWEQTGLILSHDTVTFRRGQIITNFTISTPSGTDAHILVTGPAGLTVNGLLQTSSNNPTLQGARAGSFVLIITYGNIEMRVPVVVIN